MDTIIHSGEVFKRGAVKTQVTILTWNQLWEEVREMALDMGTPFADRFLVAVMSEGDGLIWDWGIIVREREVNGYDNMWLRLLANEEEVENVEIPPTQCKVLWKKSILKPGYWNKVLVGIGECSRCLKVIDDGTLEKVKVFAVEWDLCFPCRLKVGSFIWDQRDLAFEKGKL